MSPKITTGLFMAAIFAASPAFGYRPTIPEYFTFFTQAQGYEVQGKYDLAAVANAKALRAAETEFGVDDVRLVKFVEALGRDFEKQGKQAEAASQYQRALSILERLYPTDIHEIAKLKNMLTHTGGKRATDTIESKSAPKG